jgi:MSHA biogenesis protein MshP
MTYCGKKAAGFTLITTLFLLVVVSGLASYLVNISTAQHLGSALALDALRGRHAALTGIEWVAYRLNHVAADCPPVPTTMVVEGFTVELQACRATDVTEGGGSYRLFDVTVSAAKGEFGSADHINLAVRATLRG